MISIVPLFLLIAGFFSGCRKEPPAQTETVRPVKVMTVSSGEYTAVRRYPGTVRASRRVDLSFRVSGRLIQLPIQEGQYVESGALLAQLDPRDYQTNLSDVQGRLARAQASLQLARTEYQRVLRIRDRDPGAVSASLVDQRAAAESQAQAVITSLKPRWIM